MSEVAKHAGVGIGTVSRVMSGSPKVSDTTRIKVQASAEELGYNRPRTTVPNSLPALRTGVMCLSEVRFKRVTSCWSAGKYGTSPSLTDGAKSLILPNE